MKGPATASEAEGVFLSELPVIDELAAVICRRRRCRDDEAEDFTSFVHVKLVENGYAVLRQFGGRSHLRTYLWVVIQHLFLDFRRQQWGVWRPSAEARRNGPSAILLDKLVNRERVPLEEAIETLRTNQRVPESPEQLRIWAARFPTRTPRRAEVRGNEREPSVSARQAVEVPAEFEERHRRACQLRQALREAMDNLSPADALALRMRVCDGFKMAHVAAVLGVDAKPLYRRIEKVEAALRDTLARRGFGPSDVQELLDNAAFDGRPGPDDPPASGSADQDPVPSNRPGHQGGVRDGRTREERP